MEKIKSRIAHRGILTAGLLLLGAFAYADGPTPALTPAQSSFDTFYGSRTAVSTAPAASTVTAYAFYEMFTSTSNSELQAYAFHLADQIAPAGPARDALRQTLLERFLHVAGPNRNRDSSAGEQYVLAALMFGLGRPAGPAAYPLYLLPVRSDAERIEFLARLSQSYQHYLAQDYISDGWRRGHAGLLSDPDFITSLSRDVVNTNRTLPGVGGFYGILGLRDGHAPSPLSILAPFAAGHPAPARAGAGSNPFAPVRPSTAAAPAPRPVLTTSPSGSPALDFSLLASSGSGYSWQTVSAPGGRTQRVLYQQVGGRPVEVGRVWSQGGFSYLNYTGPGGNSQEYGHLYPLGAGGALPAGQITALPPGIDYSRIQAQTVRDVLGGARQVVLLPTGNGRYRDLAGNPYETAERQEQVYYACGFRGRRTCVGYQSSSEIRPVDPGAARHQSLSMPASGAPAAAGQFSVVAQAQPNEWGARRIVHQNGHPVGYVISVGGQDVIFVGSPTSHRWAIYRMDGTPVTLNFSGQAIITRRFGGRSVGLIPVGGRRYVDIAGAQYEVNGAGVRRVDL